MIYEYLVQVGHPVRRQLLAQHFSMTDRTLRENIAKEREEGKIIINRQDGKGYYSKQNSNDTAAQLKMTIARIAKLNKAKMALIRAYKDDKRAESGKPRIEYQALF